MTTGRLHLLAQAALCYEQAGQPLEAARCRERADEPLAAADLYRAAGELTKAAVCYRKAGQTGQAAACLLSMGRAQDAANLWKEAGERLEAAWILAIDGRQPRQAARMLVGFQPAGFGQTLRLRIVTALCDALEHRPDALAAVLAEAERGLSRVSPASEQAKLSHWTVQAADQLKRPDLAAQMFATAYRCGLRGTAIRWREWAQSALGGTAGIPERDL